MIRLTPPTHVIFYISVALAIISVVLRVLYHTKILSWHPPGAGGYLILLIGYLALLAGVTLKGV